MSLVQDYDRFWDRQGKRITFEHWLVLHTDDDYVNVAKTKVGICTVSTMWTGINLTGDLVIPHIFETQIFPLHPANLPLMWHYVTEREARVGHFQASQLLRNYQGLEDGQIESQ